MVFDPEDIETALFQEIKSIKELKDLNVRVFNEGAADNTPLPYITQGIIENVETLHMKGISSIANPRFQIEIWAETGIQRFKIFKALRNGINKFSELINGIPVQTVRMLDNSNGIEKKDDGSQRFIYRKTIDLEIWWHRTSPTD